MRYKTPTRDVADQYDEAAHELYARWCADWRELDAFVAEKLGGELKGLTPRRLVAAMLGMARPHIARPLLRAFIDRTPWSAINHRHHHTDRLPIRGHVWIVGSPQTSVDDG